MICVFHKKEETIPHTEYIDQHLDSPAPNQHKSEGSEVTVEERTKPQTKEVEVTANNVLEKMPSETSASLTVSDDYDKKNNSGRIEAQSQAIQKTPLRKPQPKFGRLNPEGRSLILPGGRRWRRPGEEYNEEKIAETILAQSEIIQGKTLGINFLKYKKPPVPLDHLQRSEVYKLVHNMEQAPPRRVELLRTAISEADYREKYRSMSPHPAESHTEPLSTISQQFHP
ncbi:unnamed protein product [Parnassius apollo]|uniref:(apollo) hypothetical protein n=1 Tax=Parnassius apollo TaxID=110799 RepID=A0A8S3WUY9_PARAO|nr:unnamed protein product [Parnassius apollo]